MKDQGAACAGKDKQGRIEVDIPKRFTSVSAEGSDKSKEVGACLGEGIGSSVGPTSKLAWIDLSPNKLGAQIWTYRNISSGC